jgi:hypothetical protein
MDAFARKQLVALLASHGQNICTDPRRLRALLDDECPSLKREVNVLIAALEQRIPHEIMSASHQLPWPLFSARLIQRLVAERAMEEVAARWAVDSWGVGLGRVSESALVQAEPRANPKNTVEEIHPSAATKIQDPESHSSPGDEGRWSTRLTRTNWIALAILCATPPVAWAAVTSFPGAGYVIVVFFCLLVLAVILTWPRKTTHQPGTRRPAWVFLIFGVYVLMLVAALYLPWVALALTAHVGYFVALCVAVSVFFLLGFTLTMIPIGHYWRLPLFQNSIILPLIGSATCAATLFAGGAVASHEFLFGPKHELRFDARPEEVKERAREQERGAAASMIMLISVPIVWTAWLCIFLFLSKVINRLTWNDRIYQWLLAGSVLELLVAIPMHLIVRRRAVCCAGEGTGVGIGVGIVIMFIALGPAVFLLFFQRYKDTYSGRGKGKTRRA